MATSAGTVTEEEVVHKYRILQNEVQMLSSKSTELDLERQEHDLVLEALGNCDESRRYACGLEEMEMEIVYIDTLQLSLKRSEQIWREYAHNNKCDIIIVVIVHLSRVLCAALGEARVLHGNQSLCVYVVLTWRDDTYMCMYHSVSLCLCVSYVQMFPTRWGRACRTHCR